MLAQHEQNRLHWLDLHTRPASVRAALITLRTEALSDNAHSALAGRFLLWLWHHGNSPLDPSDLAYLDQALNFAVRHLLNFTIATQVDLRQLLTASEMAPVLAAWGENTHG